MERELTPRLMTLTVLMKYICMGREASRNFGRKAGADIRYGNLWMYDRKKIDEYIEQLVKEGKDDGRVGNHVTA